MATATLRPTNATKLPRVTRHAQTSGDGLPVILRSESSPPGDSGRGTYFYGHLKREQT